MTKKKRLEVYKKFNGLCAYSGTPLKDDWQVEHVLPKSRGGTDELQNLMPVQKIINHYKNSLNLEEFRELWLGGLHRRLKKLPKNPRTERSKKRKAYLLEVAELFNIAPDKPFSGVFYFEELKNE